MSLDSEAAWARIITLESKLKQLEEIVVDMMEKLVTLAKQDNSCLALIQQLATTIELKEKLDGKE